MMSQEYIDEPGKKDDHFLHCDFENTNAQDNMQSIYGNILIIDTEGNRFHQPEGLELSILHTYVPLLFRGCSTCDNFDQFTSNNGLTGSVEENLVLCDHISGVL